MPTNILPSGIGDLFLLADRMKAGLETHGPWLLRETVTAEDFTPLLAVAREAESAFACSRAAKATVSKRFAEADANLTSWLAKARLVVMLAYGSQWSESWLATGFTHRGTNVPKRIAPRIELARRLADFFTDFPQYEVLFAEVTAAKARELHDEITTADKEMRAAATEAKEKKRDRDTAEKKLRRRMRAFRIFLSILVKKNDLRWQAFGLNVPRPNDRPRLVRHVGESLARPLEVKFSSSSITSSSESAAA